MPSQSLCHLHSYLVHLSFLRTAEGTWTYFLSVYRTALALSSSPTIIQLRLKCQSSWLPTVNTCLSAAEGSSCLQ